MLNFKPGRNATPPKEEGNNNGRGNDGKPYESDLPKRHSLSDKEAREWYVEQERRIPDLIDKSLSLEEQARQAFDLRNQFRTEARELMSNRALAEQLNANERNMTWDEIVQKYEGRGHTGDDVYREIIESSQRSRQSLNDRLGVDPNNNNSPPYNNGLNSIPPLINILNNNRNE